MSIIDLTHTLSPDMPVYPGTEPPVFLAGCTLEADGFLEKEITFFSHTGTHIDAPAHLVAGGKTLDRFGAGHFVGEALLVDVKPPQIGLDLLTPYEKQIGKADFLILRTGWSRRWGRQDYFEDFPVLTVDAARWLTGQGLKGIGIDAISFDAVSTSDYAVHKTLLGADIILVENLAHLEALLKSTFRFICLPLKIREADGSPARAVADIS